MNEASPAFQRLLGEVDTLGLGVFRLQQKEAAMKMHELLGRSISQFRIAQQKLEAAQKVNKMRKLKPFLESKALSYDRVSQSLAVNQEIIRLVLDESIRDLQCFVPKLEEGCRASRCSGQGSDRRPATNRKRSASTSRPKRRSRETNAGVGFSDCGGGSFCRFGRNDYPWCRDRLSDPE